MWRLAAVMAGVTVMPGDSIAQKAETVGRDQASDETSKSNLGGGRGRHKRAETQRRELLLGVWRGVGAPGDEPGGMETFGEQGVDQRRGALTVFASGAFQASGAAIDAGALEVGQGMPNGRWKLDGNQLHRAIDGGPHGGAAKAVVDEIVRLDDEMLELRDPQGVRAEQFFRRVELKRLPTVGEGGIEATIKRIAEPAGLTEEETRAVEALAQRGELDGVRLDLVERAIDYQDEKAGFLRLVWVEDKKGNSHWQAIQQAAGGYAGLLALAEEGLADDLDIEPRQKVNLLLAVFETNQRALGKLVASGGLTRLEGGAVAKLRAYAEQHLDWAIQAMFFC